MSAWLRQQIELAESTQAGLAGAAEDRAESRAGDAGAGAVPRVDRSTAALAPGAQKPRAL